MRRPAADRGSALLWVLAAIGGVSVLAAALIQLVGRGHRSANFWEARLQALYAAESGLNLALYRIWERGENPPQPGTVNCDSSPWLASSQADFPAAAETGFRVCVEDSPPTGRTIVAQGFSGGQVRTVRLTLRPPLTAAAFFSEAVTKGGIHETGGTAGALPPVSLPPLTPPTGTPPGPPLSGSPVTLSPGTYRYSGGLTVGTMVRVQGPTDIYVEGDLTVGNNAVVEATGSGRVNLYVSGHVLFENNSRLNILAPLALYTAGDATWSNNARVQGTMPFLAVIGGDARLNNNTAFNIGGAADKLALYLTTGDSHDVTLSNNSVFVGGLYGPTATVELNNNSSLTGAVVAADVREGKGAIHGSDDVTHAPTPDGASGETSAWTADWSTWWEE